MYVETVVRSDIALSFYIFRFPNTSHNERSDSINVNFMDACHITVRGKNIYRENIKQLKRAYILRKTIGKYSKIFPTALGLVSLGATAMLTVHQMERKRVEAAMKLCKDWDDYKRVFVNQLEQEA